MYFFTMKFDGQVRFREDDEYFYITVNGDEQKYFRYYFKSLPVILSNSLILWEGLDSYDCVRYSRFLRRYVGDGIIKFYMVKVGEM